MKLLRWAYKHEYLDRLPRILDSDYTKVKQRVSERPKPVFWTIDEIPKGEKTQPTEKSFAQLSLDEIRGNNSVPNATRAPGFKSRRRDAKVEGPDSP